MANTVLVCGKTGAGKTTGLRGLNRNETVVFRVIKRTIPFKMEKPFKIIETPEFTDVLACLDKFGNNPHVKNIVITDATYVMRHEFFKRDKEKGYDKFTDMANHMVQIIQKIQALPDDKIVFMEYHVDELISEGTVAGYKAATVGKLLDEKYNIFENVDIILFAEPQVIGTDVNFGYYTHMALGKAGAYLPAKTPIGMFEEDFIPNDLGLVAKAIKEYYGLAEEDAAPAEGGGPAESA